MSLVGITVRVTTVEFSIVRQGSGTRFRSQFARMLVPRDVVKPRAPAGRPGTGLSEYTVRSYGTLAGLS